MSASTQLLQSISKDKNSSSSSTTSSTVKKTVGQSSSIQLLNSVNQGTYKSAPITKVSESKPVTKAPVKISKPLTPIDQAKDIADTVKVGAGVAADIAKKFTLKYLPQTAKAAKELAIDPASLKADPKKALDDYVNGIKESITGAGTSLRRIFTNDTKKAPTASERVGAGLETVARTTGAIFSPLTGLFKAAENVPYSPGVPVASIAKVINLAFSALGEGATAVSNRIVDNMIEKKDISKKDGENIRQGLGEVISLAAMFYIGGKGAKAFEIKPAKMGQLVEKYGVQDAATIVTKAKELATKKASELKPGENTPEQVINHVVSNKIEKTPQGKEMLKTAIEAQKEGATINVEHPQDNVANAGLYDTPLHQEARKYKSADEFIKAQTLEYHGSPVPLKQFHNKSGVYFTHNMEDASGFAGTPDNVYEGYLNFKKPLVIDAKGAKWDKLNTEFGKSTPDVISNAKGKGYDGVVFKNIVDNQMDTVGYGEPGTISYAYKPKDAFINESQLKDIYKQSHVAQQPKVDIKPKTEVKTEAKPQEGLKPSKIGKSIEQKAVDAKLTERFSETAGYTPIKIKEQSARATTLVNSSIDEARAIVRGEKPLPENLRGTALITAMEEHIRNNPNTDQAYELANSPLVSGTSAAAQELRLAAERTPDSATARLAEIKQAKEEAFKQKYKGRDIKEVTTKVVNDIKSKVKVPDKYDWNSFIDSIAC